MLDVDVGISELECGCVVVFRRGKCDSFIFGDRDRCVNDFTVLFGVRFWVMRFFSFWIFVLLRGLFLLFLDDFEDFDLFFWGDAEVTLVIDELFIVFFWFINDYFVWVCIVYVWMRYIRIFIYFWCIVFGWAFYEAIVNVLIWSYVRLSFWVLGFVMVYFKFWVWILDLRVIFSFCTIVRIINYFTARVFGCIW